MGMLDLFKRDLEILASCANAHAALVGARDPEVDASIARLRAALKKLEAAYAGSA